MVTQTQTVLKACCVCLAFALIVLSTEVMTSSGDASAQDARDAFRSAQDDTITARGLLVGLEGVAIRSRAAPGSGGGLSIVYLIPEGTQVEEGDLLCELDSSALEEQYQIAQIELAHAVAAVHEAQAELERALIAREEFIEGEAELAQLEAESHVVEANIRIRVAMLELEQLRGADEVDDTAVELAQLNVQLAEVELQLAEKRLEVFVEFTKPRRIVEFDSQIEAGKSHLAAMQSRADVERSRLEQHSENISHCRISTPIDGVVVYGRSRDRGSSRATGIEEGMIVRERQAILEIIDPTRLGVQLEVRESEIERVGVGEPVTLTVDALPDATYEGTVVAIDEYPLPDFSRRDTRFYRVHVELARPAEGLRPGMTLIGKIEQED